jgi:anti-anti-sigma factor
MTHTDQRHARPDRRDYRTVLTLQNGKVKDEANRLTDEITGREGGRSCPVLLDFQHVEHVISEDLGALVGLHKRVKSQGGRLTLVNVRPLVSDVLSITRLDTLFDVHRATEGPAANGASL